MICYKIEERYFSRPHPETARQRVLTAYPSGTHFWAICPRITMRSNPRTRRYFYDRDYSARKLRLRIARCRRAMSYGVKNFSSRFRDENIGNQENTSGKKDWQDCGTMLPNIATESRKRITIRKKREFLHQREICKELGSVILKCVS